MFLSPGKSDRPHSFPNDIIPVNSPDTHDKSPPNSLFEAIKLQVNAHIERYFW